MAEYNDTPINELIRICDTAWERAGEEADALFGPEDKEPSDAELEIIFDGSLDFTSKRAMLKVLRGESITPRSFDCRLTDGDYLHARALGIHLEDETEQGRR
jgi:hypothetical protein